MLKRFVLEERADYKRLDVDPAKYPPDAHDTFIQHRDGYTTVCYFSRLPEVGKLCEALNASRVEVLLERANARTSDDLADRLDEEDAIKQAARSREFRGNVDAIASSEYDSAQWRIGSRVAVPRAGFQFSRASQSNHT